jgi:hypothetical protein
LPVWWWALREIRAEDESTLKETFQGSSSSHRGGATHHAHCLACCAMVPEILHGVLWLSSDSRDDVNRQLLRQFHQPRPLVTCHSDLFHGVIAVRHAQGLIGYARLCFPVRMR